MAVMAIVGVCLVVIVALFLIVPAVILERRRQGKKGQMSQTYIQTPSMLSGGTKFKVISESC